MYTQPPFGIQACKRASSRPNSLIYSFRRLNRHKAVADTYSISVSPIPNQTLYKISPARKFNKRHFSDIITPLGVISFLHYHTNAFLFPTRVSHFDRASDVNYNSPNVQENVNISTSLYVREWVFQQPR